MDRIGRYKIVRELGRGAMGVVYHAIDPNIGRPVAIKTINLSMVLAPEEQERLRERLLREARSAGSLSHPGIVTIYDVEQQGDSAYIAMEFVDGPTLDQMMSGLEPMAPDRMFSLLGQTCAALDYAHGKGIVHRDIKPANIMVASDGTAKIADFGIAKITASEQFTMTGSIVGTPHYMSPEQVQGQPVDGRSDQFSLAVIAFEMLTGEKPYTGEHLTTVVYKIVAEEPPILHRINPSLSGQIEAVIRKGLAKKPDQRYRTCSEFADALERACSATKGWQAMARGGSLNAPTVGGAQPMPVALPPARKPLRDIEGTAHDGAGKPKSKFVPFLLALLMAIALIGVVWWQVKPGLTSKDDQETADTAADTKAPETPAPTTPPPKKPSPVDPVKSNPVETAKVTPPPVADPPAPKESEKKQSKLQFVPAAPVTPPVTPPVKSPARKAAAGPPQQVRVITAPSGAIAELDGKADTDCTTTCILEATPGRHSLTIRKAGFISKRQDIDVGSSALELPPIVLGSSSQGVSLMVSSEPSGAAIIIEGKRQEKLTNAIILLPPGTYNVTVEWKDGRAKTQIVEVKDSPVSAKFIQQ